MPVEESVGGGERQQWDHREYAVLEQQYHSVGSHVDRDGNKSARELDQVAALPAQPLSTLSHGKRLAMRMPI